MNTPRLTVGLPVYNGEKYVAASIEALLGQTYEDFELIISDNASTDATTDICLAYAKSDSRVRVIRQKRYIGLAPNHNVVRDEARGEFFKWAAADDLYGRDLLKSCVEALDRYPDVVLAHAYQAVLNADGEVTQAMEYPLVTDAVRPSDRFRSSLFGGSGLFDSADPAHPGLVRVDHDGILSFCDEYGVMRTAVLRSISRTAATTVPTGSSSPSSCCAASSTSRRSGSTSGATRRTGPTTSRRSSAHAARSWIRRARTVSCTRPSA